MPDVNYIYIADFLGAILALFSTLLAARANFWTWPLSIICNIINFFLYFHKKIYADSFLAIIFLSLSIYGLYSWYSNKNIKSINNSEVQISHITKTIFINSSALSVITFFIIFKILSLKTDSDVPISDAMVVTLGIIAHWFTCKKYIESWIIWTFYNLIVIALFAYKNLPAHIITHIIYLPIAIYGYNTWKKKMSCLSQFSQKPQYSFD
tara:strand:+ start:10172 stop:10798 length:627 start_codon:yes stop_codon:yes gene_type:complete